MIDSAFCAELRIREDSCALALLRASRWGDLLPKLTCKSNSGMSNSAHAAAAGLFVRAFAGSEE